jgi:hypothetical protein
MNILHNAEAVFAIVAGITVGAGAMLPGASADHGNAPAQSISIAMPGRMAVVQVPARRLTVVEKMRSLEDERALARAAVPPRG